MDTQRTSRLLALPLGLAVSLWITPAHAAEPAAPHNRAEAAKALEAIAPYAENGKPVLLRDLYVQRKWVTHMMMNEEPGRMLMALVATVRPIAAKAGDVAP